MIHLFERDDSGDEMQDRNDFLKAEAEADATLENMLSIAEAYDAELQAIAEFDAWCDAMDQAYEDEYASRMDDPAFDDMIFEGTNI